MNFNIAATKSNLIKTKKTLSLSREGYELLDEKRRILLQELTTVIDSVDRNQQQVDDALSRAYKAVDRATVRAGGDRIHSLSISVDIKSRLAITSRRVMGVSVPVINVDIQDKPPYYSLHEVDLSVDDAVREFKELLSLLAVLAEKKITLLRLAQEARKTIRKVNALEKVYIPYYSDTFKYIGDRLDEESRDSFSMLKLIKKEKTRQ